MSEKGKQKQKTTTAFKVWTVVGIVLCILLVPILIINCTLIVKGYTNSDKVPSFGGVFPMIVLTDSMSGTFESGDLIICHTEDPAEVKEGDIIFYYDPMGSGSTTVTHRVTQVTTAPEGGIAWVTKGDANNTEDLALVRAEDLVGVYQMHLAGLGSAALFMQTTPGLIICVLCPTLLLVAYDVIRRRLYEKRQKQDTDALMAELAALRAEKERKDSD